ncbi:MAG TPA: TolC family protein [Candidatus Luteimonas excrementigallinarum]|nr:TolC family protein [Candidatus Luteimonas excrementigallinarum]
MADRQGARRQMRRFMLGPMLLLATATGHAQEMPAPVELTFEQAHARLEQVSDALAAADANLRGKQDLADASRRMRLPELSLEARYMEFQKTLELPPGSLAPVAEAFGIDSPLRFRQRDWRMRPMVTAVLPLYTGGQIPAARGAAAAAVREADAERAQQAQRLVSELVEAYFGLRLAEQAVAVRREIRDGMERHLAHTALLEREGFATRAQRMQATVARDGSEREYRKAVNERDAASAGLALMLRSGGPLVPATPLFVDSAPVGTLEEFTRAALDNHPQLAQLRALDAQAGEGVRAQQAALKPQVFLFGQYDLHREDALLTDPDWAFGVGVKYTFLSGRDRPRRISAARAQQDQAQAALREAQNRVAIGVAQAWNALETARQQYLLQDSSIGHARENLRLQELSFREGQSTSLDVIDARLGLGGALVERARAAFEYDVALARLLELSGQSARFADHIRRADHKVLP